MCYSYLLSFLHQLEHDVIGIMTNYLQQGYLRYWGVYCALVPTLHVL